MSVFVGIRHEDKYALERRAPLTPMHIEKLAREQYLNFVVQSSEKRIFKDTEYQSAGAEIASDLKKCSVIFGVKEIPEHFFEPGKTYLFFSHIIKGQAYNMPMLRKMMEMGCNFIDYERIVDSDGRRLIFFGRYAGLAGMINSLWSLGLRLKYFGIDNPFESIRQAYTYASLEDAKKDISLAGYKISEQGLPKELNPLTFGFTGSGNVSNGAQEILNLLPVKEISPNELLSLHKRGKFPGNHVYKTVFREEDMVAPKDKGVKFELLDYYANPHKYKGVFQQYLSHLTVLMNCMYWDERYPKILTKDDAKKLCTTGKPKLTVIGDITCDPEGSVEITHKGTPIDDPVFVYNPLTGQPAMGHKGEGLLVMAVDILPSELPRESSMVFGDALYRFIPAITKANYNVDFEDIDLPAPVKKAMILHKGKLTPDYEYIEKYL